MELEHDFNEEHEYDGITELDNPPPRWLIYLLYATVFIAAFYLFHYHVYKQGDLQTAEYENEMKSFAKADTAGKQAVAIKIASDPASREAGKKLYVTKTCSSCHGEKGEGNQIGPSLIDSLWIYGSQPENVFATIKKGVPQKGMAQFENLMSDEEILQTMSYIFYDLRK